MATFTSSFHINPASGLSQASQSAPVPWLAPACSILATLINMLAKSESNKNGMRLLEERCLSFLVVITSEGEAMAPDEKIRLCSGAQSTFQGILDRMTPWCLMSRIKLFVKQDELAGVIQDCHFEISDSLTKLQIASHLEIHKWQAAFEESQKIDNEHVVQYLSDLDNRQQLLVDTQLQQSEDLRRILTMMQDGLAENAPETVGHGLGSNLYNLLQQSHTLLPNMNLQRGEVKRTSRYAVKGTAHTDIWEGCYLNEEKVAIKTLRTVSVSPKTLKRFKVEAEIWRRVYETDKGKYILPIYGFCQDDGDYPYIVSPWILNGNLIDYVKGHPEVDHRYMLKYIAEGVNFLHSMLIVHGDIKGFNISISPDGRPLISDFGFTRLQEDIMRYFDVSNGSTLNQESLRWCAAELCWEGSKRTMGSDVYAFSMTALELMTHEEPWAFMPLATQVLLRVCKGETPPRPMDPIVAERGLDDALWALLAKCWTDIDNRITMKEFVNCL